VAPCRTCCVGISTASDSASETCRRTRWRGDRRSVAVTTSAKRRHLCRFCQSSAAAEWPAKHQVSFQTHTIYIRCWNRLAHYFTAGLVLAWPSGNSIDTSRYSSSSAVSWLIKLMFYIPSVRSFRRRSSQPISWLSTEKLKQDNKSKHATVIKYIAT